MTQLDDREQNLLNSAIQFAKEAGVLIRSRSGMAEKVQEKTNISDLVTEMDQRSEQWLRKRILENYPDHWILSEEDNGQANSYEMFRKNGPGYGWVLDPIDGTTNYIHGVPYFAVSIGIVKQWEPVVGVVYNPVTEDLYVARKNCGATYNGNQLHIGSQQKLKDSLIATGFSSDEWHSDSSIMRQMDRLAGNCRNMRVNGAATLDLCGVASGILTGYWQAHLNPWDTAAGMLILLESGGQVTDWQGNPFRLDHTTLVASNGKIHDQLLKAIQL